MQTPRGKANAKAWKLYYDYFRSNMRTPLQAQNLLMELRLLENFRSTG
jgi:hypothetical protein